MKKRRGPGDLRGLADAYLTRLDPEGKRFTSAAASVWGRVAGPEVDRHTTGMALRNGELLVYVDSPVWATELSLMGEQYRVRINEEIGQELVRSVRFSVSRKVREEKRIAAEERQTREHYRAARGEPAALTEVERAQVEHMAAGIHDSELRDAAVRAMVRHLEWKKDSRTRNGPQAPSE